MTTNKYIVEDNNTYLEITRKNGDKYYYLIDKEDIPRLKITPWAVAVRHAGVYAYSIKMGLLHRYILGVKDKSVVDHINRNTFDNRKANLRITNYLINAINSRKPRSYTNIRYIEPVKEKRRKQKYSVNVCKRFRCRCYSLKEAIITRNEYIRKFEPLIWSIHEEEFMKDFREYIDEDCEEEEEEPEEEE